MSVRNESRSALLVEDLKVDLIEKRTVVVDGVSLRVDSGETLGIAGESGCGKSVTLRAILGTLDRDHWAISNSRLQVGGDDFDGRRMAEARGKVISLIPQNPLVALSPIHRIESQLGAVIKRHSSKMTNKSIQRRSIELLERVGIPDPAGQLRRYPHEFSGGMLQRITIAMAVAHNPAVLLADEPTTALDVTVQAQILELLREMQERYGMALVMVTHDLGVMAKMADRIAIMYAGRVVEGGQARDTLRRPLHPYTNALIECLPSGHYSSKRLISIVGEPARPEDRPTGCAYHPRCPRVNDNPACLTVAPPPSLLDDRLVECHNAVVPTTSAELDGAQC